VTPQTVLLVAGDPSGDLHGARLARALKRQAPSLRIAAVGGPLLKAAADEFIEDLASHGITGFWEPVRQVPRLVRAGRRIAEFMARRRPRAVVCIDYYGFNRRVLGLARRAGLPTYYFISPQVWASRPGRVGVLKRLVDHMMVIFPFEETIYRKAGVRATFVGHPLLDILPPPLPEREAADVGTIRIGLLPGSRSSEVHRHLPVLLAAFALIKKQYPQAKASVFAAPSLPDEAYGLVGKDIPLIRESDYSRRRTMTLVLTSSGTATLETALLGIPMVVLYKLSWPTYAIARALIRVPYISMANLLAGRRLVPEFVQRQATPASVSAAALDLLDDPRRLAALRKDLLELRGRLGGPGACERAALLVLGGEGTGEGRPHPSFSVAEGLSR